MSPRKIEAVFPARGNHSPASIYRFTTKLFDLALPGIPDSRGTAMRVADFLGRDSVAPDGSREDG